MRNRHDLILEETESQEASLPVRYSHILRGQRKSGEHSLRMREVYGVLAQVGAPFRLIPNEC